MKVCNTCKESKSLDEFHKDRNSKDGKVYMCKVCSSKKQRKQYVENPERYKEMAKKWQTNNPERNRENQTRNHKKYHLILEYRLKASIRGNYHNVIPKGHRHDIEEILGCDMEFYIKYIESLWLKEFSWENHGEIWEIDHIIPRKDVEFKALKSQKHIFGYKNTRPLFKTSQIAKSYGYNNIVGNKNKGDTQKTKRVDTKIIT